MALVFVSVVGSFAVVAQTGELAFVVCGVLCS